MKLFSLALLFCFVTSQIFPSSAAAADFQTDPANPLIPEKTPDDQIPQTDFSSSDLGDPSANFLMSADALSVPPENISPLPNAQSFPVTQMPVLSNGERPAWKTEVSYDPNNSNPALQDYSNLQTFQFSASALQVNYNLYNTFSAGRAYVSYDDPETLSVETADFAAAFSDGIVLGLDNGALATQQVIFQLTDINGNIDSVVLAGITIDYQRWRIDLSNFTDVDLTKIREASFVFSGREVNGRLNVDWGDTQYVPRVYSSLNNPQTYTSVPLLADGTLPVLRESVSFDPAQNDWSEAQLVNYASDFTQLNFNLYNTTSFASASLNYDDPSTTQIESFDFDAFFSNGLVIGLDNGGIGSLQEIYFALEDALGKEDRVLLSGIGDSRQFYKMTYDLFDEIDIDHISKMSFTAEGRYSQGARLNIQWGNFTTPSYLQGTEFDETKITQLPAVGNLTESGGDTNTGAPNGKIALTRLSSNEFEYQYDLWSSNSAYTTVDITAPGGAAFSLPQTLVLALRGTEGGQAKVQVIDVSGKTATFTVNLKAYYQNFELELSGEHVPHFFDRTQISRIRFLQDRNTYPVAFSDLIKVKLKGVEYSDSYISPELQAFKADVLQRGLDFFSVGQGVDPVTHLPYDRANTDGTVDPTHKITQPTLTGFYLQMLADFVRGKLVWEGQTLPNALNEIDTVLGSLLNLQAEHGWKGLVPWIDQGQPYDNVGIGDNANLSQSLAVMIGALEMAPLTPEQRTQAEAITEKAETFMDRQQEGYLAAVDKTFNIFPSKIITATGAGVGFIDRLMTEFRGAIAFLLVRYPSLPRSVWNNLTYTLDGDYKAQSGNPILNLQSYEGGAFQYFWPLLRNNERDYVGFRNALYNYYVTQTDYAAANRIPGFLSASDMPDNIYQGLQGIPQIAETQDPLLIDLGSTYAIGSAFAVNQFSVLEWLAKIKEQLPELYGIYGFADSGRSGTDVNKFYLGIDIASTILGLTNAGPEAFETYLRNRGLEDDYNTLYDQRGRFGLAYTYEPAAHPPEFPDRSFNVFNHVQVDGTLGAFPYMPTSPAGVRYFYNGFGTTFDGRFWEFNQTYDAQANQLEILYSVTDSPTQLIIELKDGSTPEKLLYRAVVEAAGDNKPYQKLIVQLPNDTLLNNVKKLFILPNQSTQDTHGDFMIHAINFKHYPSGQELTPLAGGKPDGETTFDQPYFVDVFASNPASHGEEIAPKTHRLYYDVSESGSYSALSFFSDPDNDGQGLFDFSQKSRIVFGLNSDTVNTVKVEIEDSDGTRAAFYATGIDVARNYYAFLTASLPQTLNRQKIKRITFVIDQNLAAPEDVLGSFDVELL